MISPSLQKVLALLLLGIVLMGFSVLVPLPYLNWVNSKQESIEALEGNLQRYRAFQEKADLYGEALENSNPETFKALLFRTKTPSLAAANLQGEFNQLARAAGINGGSFRPLSASELDGLTRFGFRVTFQSTTYKLLDLLGRIDGAEKYYFLDNIKIKSPAAQGQGSDPTLNIQMDVFGFMEHADG